MSAPDLPSTPKLRFGIMCHGDEFSAWEAQCIRTLLQSGDAEPALLIVEQAVSAPTSRRRRLARIRHAGFALYTRLWLGRRSRALRRVSMRAELADVARITCTVRWQGDFSQYFDPADLELVRAHKLDFILRFAFNILRGGILEAATHGIWSYHHDDERRYRGRPPCYWPIVNGDAVSGAILQRLTERLDAGVVLMRGFFRTQRSYTRNLDGVYGGSAAWAARVAGEIRRGQTAGAQAEPSSSRAAIVHPPGNLAFAAFLARRLGDHLRWVYRKLFLIDIWNIAIIERPVADVMASASSADARWLQAPGGTRFWADPFALERDGCLQLLFEDCDYARAGKGVISHLRIDAVSMPADPQLAIETTCHMSYPFLFEWRGSTYCLPETFADRRLVLWRAQSFPTRWEQAAVLLDDFAAVDATLFEHGGRWWLFAADGERDASLEVFAWYGETPLGPFKRHALNPLKCDVRSSRPAGTPFVTNGELYRPAQDGSRSYGGAISFNRIVELSPTTFSEEVVSQLKPAEGSAYPDGLHTITGVGRRTVIDGKVESLRLTKAWTKLRGRLSRARVLR